MNSVANELKRGGEWLLKARTWMQSNIKDGDTLHWGSSQDVSIPFNKLEEFALIVAIAAVQADRINRE